MYKTDSDDIYSDVVVRSTTWPSGETSIFSKQPVLTSFRNRYWATQPRPFVQTLPYDVSSGSCGPAGLVVTSTDPKAADGSQLHGYYYPDLLSLMSYYSYCPIDSSYDLTKAQNEVISKVGEDRFSSIEFFAEFPKTVDFMHDLGKRALHVRNWLRRLPRQLLRSRRVRLQVGRSFNKDVSDILDELANAWLVWRYCILTSMMDAEDMAKAAVDHLYQFHTGDLRAVRSPQGRSMTRSWQNQPAIGLITNGSAYYFQSQADLTICYSLKVKAWILHTRAITSTGAQAFHRWGMNPLEAAWNLTPLSFVADWALQIGDYLAGQTALLGRSVVAAGTGVQLSMDARIKLRGTNLGVWETPCSFSASLFTYTRTSWEPVYEYQMAISASEVFNTNRLLDTAALFRSLT